MKLLHRVVKSSQGISFDGTVSIDNTVVVKKKPEFDFMAESDVEIPVEVEQELNRRMENFEEVLENKECVAFEKINEEKSRIISEAMREAEKIRKDAETSAIVLKEQARDQGFQEGKQEASNKMQEYLKTATTLLEELNARKESIYITQENELIDLVYNMAEKITLSELKTDKDIIFSIIKQACKNFRNSDYVKISIAKCDVSETVVTDEKLLKSIVGNIPEVEMELLPDAQSGTILLDNDKEIIDASIPTQLELLQEIMNGGKKPTS